MQNIRFVPDQLTDMNLRIKKHLRRYNIAKF